MKSNGVIPMSEAFNESVKLYWMARKTEGANREFNIESKAQSVHDDYYTCLRILAMYSRTHEDSVLAYSIWGGRKNLGLKFYGKTVKIGGVKGSDIPTGLTHEIKSPFELRRWLENTMGFTLSNLNEQAFDKAFGQLKRIEVEKRIKIDPQEPKQWSFL